MKKILLLTSVLLFLIVIGYSQTSSEILNNYDRTVYWFNLHLMTVINDETGKQHFEIEDVYQEIYQGTIKEFEKILFKTFKAGHFSVGYFNTKPEAEEALRLYAYFINSNESEYRTVESDVFPEKIYWYVLKPRQKNGKWYIPRTPAAIAQGSLSDFYFFCSENLLVHYVTLGPFIYGRTAEDSKRIYRLK